MAAAGKVVVVTLVVTVWIVGVVVAQSNPDSINQTPTVQDTQPLEPFTSCADMRSRLGDEFYTLYKGRLPQGVLKELLPLFVEPLLDPECASMGYSTWLKSYPDDKAAKRLKRAFLGLDFFMPGATPAKDPADHPPGGVNPFKDPGDRMMASMGMPKDPGDHPAAASAAMSRINTMMAMARMFSPRPRPSRNFAPYARPQPPNPYQKVQRGRIYGDAWPGHGRRKKRASGDNGDGTDVVTIGDVTMPTDTFNNIVAPDRPDRKERYYSRGYYPPPQPYYPPPQPYYPPPPYYPPQQAYYPPQQPYYPPQQRYFRPSNNNNYLYRNQGAMMAQRRQAQALARQRQAAQILAARQAQALAAQQRGQGLYNRQAAPSVFARLTGPPPQQSQVPYQVAPPVSSQQVFGSQLPRYVNNAAPQSAPQAPVPGSSPPAAVPVDPSAAAAASPSRRVKRASEEESSSSSDPSPADVVTFGDVVLPTDTFNKMISRPEDPRPRLPRYPPPAYYPPPVYRPPVVQPYYRPNNYVNLYNNRRAYPVNNGYLKQYPASNGYPANNGYPASNGYPANNGYYPPVNNGFVPGRNGPPLPMGAAKPVIYGNGYIG